MIIDVHNHPHYRGYGPKKVVDNMNQYGIDLTVLLSWEAPATEFHPEVLHEHSPLSSDPLPFSACLEYKYQYPDRFLLGYCPDPRVPGACARLKAATELYDLSICGELKLRMMYDNPDAIRLYRTAGELGLPVLMHFEYGHDTPNNMYPWPDWWYGGGIDVLERVLQQCPETTFIGHAMGFWAHISNDDGYKQINYPTGDIVPGGRVEQLLEKYPNLYCDTCGRSGCNALTRNREFGRNFLIRWQDRVLYARDLWENFHQETINSFDLPKEVRYKLYEGNARKILRGGDKIPQNVKLC